jgi:hypothetical protein
MNRKVKSEEVKDLPMTSYNGKFFVIDVELYNCQFLISINQDNEDLVISLIEAHVLYSAEDPDLKYYMEHFLGMENNNLARTVRHDNGVISIKINKFDENDGSHMATLVHELSHAVMFTFDRIGMPHNADTDEAYSYLLGFLMKKFFENIR